MKGLPKQLQTREDFNEALLLAETEKTIAHALANHFKGLLESSYKYEFDKNLNDGENPDGTLPDFVVIEKNDEQNIKRHQLKRVIDENSRLFSLGFDVATVTIIINKLEQ
ncbi:MAG: hypothetical protein JHC38_01720 [Thiotrichales bacterium]|jgi:hypothetical protein|nr:hypothetical protein [Thiotrichales bacterium]